MSTEISLGRIVLYPGSRVPDGWMACEGQVLEKAKYPKLFELLGALYGGDGNETFALPDLRGRAPMHYGTGPGLPAYNLGERGGVASVVLHHDEMTSHHHAAAIVQANGMVGFMVSSQAATTDNPLNGFLAATSEHTYTEQSNTDSTMPGQELTLKAATYAGSNYETQAHTNMQPYLAMRFIIRVG